MRVLPVPTASIPRWANPVDDDLRRRAQRQLSSIERHRVQRFDGQLVLGWGPMDNRLLTPESRSVRHEIIVILNREAFTDTQVGRLLGMDRRSVAYVLDLLVGAARRPVLWSFPDVARGGDRVPRFSGQLVFDWAPAPPSGVRLVAPCRSLGVLHARRLG